MILPTAKEIYRLNEGIPSDFFSVEYVLSYIERKIWSDFMVWCSYGSYRYHRKNNESYMVLYELMVSHCSPKIREGKYIDLNPFPQWYEKIDLDDKKTNLIEKKLIIYMYLYEIYISEFIWYDIDKNHRMIYNYYRRYRWICQTARQSVTTDPSSV